jgi:tetrahydromethanopterin S-methyltransferase subunit F
MVYVNNYSSGLFWAGLWGFIGGVVIAFTLMGVVCLCII